MIPLERELGCIRLLGHLSFLPPSGNEHSRVDRECTGGLIERSKIDEINDKREDTRQTFCPVRSSTPTPSRSCSHTQELRVYTGERNASHKYQGVYETFRS